MELFPYVLFSDWLFFFSFSIILLEFIQVEIGINSMVFFFFLMLSSILFREWNMAYSFLYSWKVLGFFQFFTVTNKPTELVGTLKLL